MSLVTREMQLKPQLLHVHRMAKIKNTDDISVDKDMEQPELSRLGVGRVKGNRPHWKSVRIYY